MDLEDRPMNVEDYNISEETMKIISSLPSETDFSCNKLFNYEGYWYYKYILQGVLNFQKGFQQQDTDVILASYPKSGSTWFKALTVALLERSKTNDHHPLVSDNPHGIVPFLEIDMYFKSSSPDLTRFSSNPRLFSTHMPLHAMQDTLKNSPCKIVYVCRNAKDALVSNWFFSCSILQKEPSTSILESIVKSVCNGTSFCGPVWEHVLSYWRASLEHPKKILFLRYEEMKAEPRAQIKRLAEFLGCPFTKEEEENGSVDQIVELCSLRNLSSLEVNNTGKINEIDHKFYFRKGEVGDWKNYLTPEMENKIDMIIQEKFQDSRLKF